VLFFGLFSVASPLEGLKNSVIFRSFLLFSVFSSVASPLRIFLPTSLITTLVTMSENYVINDGFEGGLNRHAPRSPAYKIKVFFIFRIKPIFLKR